MHLHLEESLNARSDCSILSLSWMGKVPDEMPEEEGWKVNRVQYYQEGWLATGNARGIVGVTYTASHSKKTSGDPPSRTNYNLRGHRSEVTLVKWNEPFQKLATCDSSGTIFVWIKYEGRWSIELINDRNTPVTHFSWSHDGKMALICYQDGFVLVGSVAGQRYWSTSLNLSSTITTGIFTPNDQQVYFGTTSGSIVVMDVHGAMVSQVTLLEDTPIRGLCWSCQKFCMGENEDSVVKNNTNNHLLAVVFQSGLVYLVRGYDDVSPIIVNTRLRGACAEWANSGELLSIAGHKPDDETLTSVFGCPTIRNFVHFYTRHGSLRFSLPLPPAQNPVTALTWGHNDKRVFIATGPQLFVGRVSRRIASLQLLCRLCIKSNMQSDEVITSLPIPRRLKALVISLYSNTIRSYVPQARQMRHYVTRPPSNSQRLHCTMIRHDEDFVPTPGTCYTLYLEYLGGLVPLLKGKRTSKLRPEFVIFDPQIESECSEGGVQRRGGHSGGGHSSNSPNESSDTEYEDLCASPRLQRRRKVKRRVRECLENENGEDLIYLDTLPEQSRLVEVTSNIWGTKFKLHGLASSLPANLGQVTYKTSLLHLQPRQMTLVITELRDDIPLRPDPSFNPNAFSEDEDDQNEPPNPHQFLRPIPNIPTIAPMTPRRTPSCYSMSTSQVEESSYVDVTSTDMLHLRDSLKTSQREHDHVHLTAPSRVRSPLACDNRSCPRPSSPEIRIRPGEKGESASRHQYVNTSSSSPSSTSRSGSSSEHSSTHHHSPQHNFSHSHSPCINSSGKSDLIKYIDEESGDSDTRSYTPSPSRSSRQMARPSFRKLRERSKSVGYLNSLDQSHDSPSRHFHQLTSIEAFLIFRRSLSLKDCKKKPSQVSGVQIPHRPLLVYSGKSRSLDSSLLALNQKNVTLHQASHHPPRHHQFSHQRPVLITEKLHLTSTNERNHCHTPTKIENKPKSLKDSLLERLRHDSPSHPQPPPTPKHVPSTPEPARRLLRTASPGNASRSIPSTPTGSRKARRHQSSSPIRKRLLSSPLLSRRRHCRGGAIESSDEGGDSSDAEFICPSAETYHDLETFQKNQLRNKLRRTRAPVINHPDQGCSVSRSSGEYGTPILRHRQFMMHNKAPLWNENSQVYQLDFSGRVTQESAKNFQIEFKGKQVMQFGRIDGNAYTLDFQYPFSAVQAFAVALANVTQRLK